MLALEPTRFEYRQLRLVDLTELPTSVHWQRPSPARSPRGRPCGPAACHVPLFMSPRPCGRARCAVHTHVDVHGRHGDRRVHTPCTDGRYMPVHASTGVYWTRRRYLACHLTWRVC